MLWQQKGCLAHPPLAVTSLSSLPIWGDFPCTMSPLAKREIDAVRKVLSNLLGVVSSVQWTRSHTLKSDTFELKSWDKKLWAFKTLDALLKLFVPLPLFPIMPIIIIITATSSQNLACVILNLHISHLENPVHPPVLLILGWDASGWCLFFLQLHCDHLNSCHSSLCWSRASCSKSFDDSTFHWE